jgi:hypothetical protein
MDEKINYPHLITGQDAVKFHEEVAKFFEWHTIVDHQYNVTMFPVQATPSLIAGVQQVQMQMIPIFTCYIVYKTTPEEIKKLQVQQSLKIG